MRDLQDVISSALHQLNRAVGRHNFQFSSAAAHRSGKILRAETPLHGNRKVRVNLAVRGPRIHLEFGRGRQRHIHAAIRSLHYQRAVPFRAADGHVDSTVGGCRRSPLARGNVHVAVCGRRLHNAVQVVAIHISIGRQRMETHAAGHLHAKVNLCAMRVPSSEGF